VYKITCHNCSSTYIGETGRSYSKRRGTQKRIGIRQQQNIDTSRMERIGNRNQKVSHNRSCGKRKPCHRLVQCQNPRPRKSSEDTAAQRVYPHTQGGQLYEERWGSLPTTTYDRILVTCSSATSRDHMPGVVRRWRTKRYS